MVQQCHLIVNADDLGWAPGRDRGIFAAIDHGIVTSVSLMANGSTFSAAVAALAGRAVAVGVHLNLSEGVALSGPIGGLSDGHGRFLGKDQARQVVAAGAFDVDAARHELCVQVQRLIDAGLCPDHVDSHQHLCLLPALTPLLIDVCRVFDIGSCRLPWPAEAADADPGGRLAQELRLYRHHAPAMQRQLRQAALFAPHRLWGMPLLNRLTTPTLLATLAQLTPGCWELMVHPGEEDLDQAFGGNERCLELQALCSDRVRRAIIEQQIVLTTFGAARCIF